MSRPWRHQDSRATLNMPGVRTDRLCKEPFSQSHSCAHIDPRLPTALLSESRMRATAQSPSPMSAMPGSPQHLLFRGKVHRRPTALNGPFPASSPVMTRSPTSSSSASSSSSATSTTVRPVLSSHGTSQSIPRDDGDLWASIRLASSPLSASTQSRPTVYAAPRPPQHQHQSVPNDDTVLLPLVIDDFSFERMTHVPTVRAPPLAQQPKASSWSTGRRQPKPEQTSSAAPLARAQSLNTNEIQNAAAAHDITLMDHRLFVSRDQWVPHRDRRCCVVCDREFGMLRKKHSCRMCGDVVCSRCSLFKNVKLPGVVGESKARVCSRCFLQYRQRVFLTQQSVEDVDNTGNAQHVPMQEVTTEHDRDNNDSASNSEDECAYDSSEELPSVEDVMRRTAAKVTGFNFSSAVTPVDLGGHRKQHKRVSLLAPELMESIYRESAAMTSASSFTRQHLSHTYGRSPSVVPLSPASSYDLLDIQLFDFDRTQSFSSSISTASSSLSSSSIASTVSSMRSVTEEELAAAMRAQELEKEVEASRERIKELELKMQEQENKKAELSLEQQKQLSEARELIAQLQKQLKQQEQNARDAAMTRDTICMTNLRQMQLPQVPVPEKNRSARHRSDSVESDSEALRQKLRLLERQLQQAGINVAEVIPYAVAKQRIMEISSRMTEISEAEASMKLKNPKGVAALRREYYMLEQDMERFHTALLMSDEYIEEQAAKEREWESGHALANAQALRTVRSALPVDISRLSEQNLRTMVTPSGKHMSADLARRFKRTNVLQLLRFPPQTIVRMHPSVIESYRTTGLTLIERRALHAALKEPASEWQKQARDEIAQKKAKWFKKLKDAFVQALVAYEHHIVQHHMGEDVQCPFIGKMCVLRAEQAVTQLYAAKLGFPDGEEYFQQEIIKSDPEGAGEKALMEAKVQAQAAAKLNARQRELKKHYGLRNIRLVTMAIAALEEIDAAMERLRVLDAQAAIIVRELDEEQLSTRWWHLCDDIVHETRELSFHLARRAGVCLIGKRDHNKDEADTRSKLEARASHSAACFMSALIDDVVVTISRLTLQASGTQLKNSLSRIREVLDDVQAKNDLILSECDDPLLPVLESDGEDSNDEEDVACTTRYSRVVFASAPSRVPWMEREVTPEETPVVQENGSIADVAVEAPQMPSSSTPTPPRLPRSSFLLDAIRAKRGLATNTADESSVATRAPTTEMAGVITPAPSVVKKAVDNAPKANDLFAAIRARRSTMIETANEPEMPGPVHLELSEPLSNSSIEVTSSETTVNESVKTTDEAPKATNLLAAIRARKAKVNAVSAVATVDNVVMSA